MKPLSILWFRNDLRLADNPALTAAARDNHAVLPVYVHDPAVAGDWATGAASSWWRHQALDALRQALDRLGLPLLFLQGDAVDQLSALCRQSGAARLCRNLRVEPWAIRQDEMLDQRLRPDGIAPVITNGGLLWRPGTVQNQSGDPFRVFTPFWKQARKLPVGAPEALDSDRLDAPDTTDLGGVSLESLGLLPKRDWADGFPDHWDSSLHGASAALERFVEEGLDGYRDRRDRPDVDGTSRLSPYLHFGQLGPRQVWHAVHAAGVADSPDGFKFLSELAWREFAHHLLFHFPHTPDQALNEGYRHFPWQPDEDLLRAWQRGRTGYPIVDAGMRQLWATGWMHNRVRMVAASLLVKHLLQPWQSGARWFWDTLVDADLANNTLGWQWVAGSGADAAPYFRIFNPMLQGEKFDVDGDYVRRWVPELSKLPAPLIHQPWTASKQQLNDAGIRLGEDYPRPIVEHREGRQRALDALSANKARSA